MTPRTRFDTATGLDGFHVPVDPVLTDPPSGESALARRREGRASSQTGEVV